MSNPWIPAEVVVEAPVLAEQANVHIWQPQRLDVNVQAALPVRAVNAAYPLWIVGAHGGAGTSTWARLLGCGDAGCAWPLTSSPSSVRVLVAARSHKSGLEAARRAAIQWAGGDLPHIQLVGLLLTPDAPGRTPKPLREVVQSVSGAFPQVFDVPWVEPWRVSPPNEITLDKTVTRLAQRLSAFTER